MTTALLVASAALSLLCGTHPCAAGKETPAALQAPAAESNEILAVDARRIAAMINNDGSALAVLLSDRLIYGHSDGRVQTKAQLLTALAENRMQYRRVRYEERQVTAFGDTRTLSGVAAIQVNANGTLLEFTVRFLAVYVNEQGAWKLAAYQSTQILPQKR